MKKVIFFLLFTGVAVGEQYLCVPEHSTGFSYDNVQKEWKNTNFTADGKYVIAKADETKHAWQVTEIGETSSSFRCESDFTEYGYLRCSGIGGEFNFNKRNGRFLRSYLIGYYTVIPEVNQGKDEGSDTPLIGIGKCSPF